MNVHLTQCAMALLRGDQPDAVRALRAFARSADPRLATLIRAALRAGSEVYLCEPARPGGPARLGFGSVLQDRYPQATDRPCDPPVEEGVGWYVHADRPRYGGPSWDLTIIPAELP